jgi:hypothetical protein
LSIDDTAMSALEDTGFVLLLGEHETAKVVPMLPPTVRIDAP